MQSGFTDAITRSDSIGSEEKLFLRFTFDFSLRFSARCFFAADGSD